MADVFMRAVTLSHLLGYCVIVSRFYLPAAYRTFGCRLQSRHAMIVHSTPESDAHVLLYKTPNCTLMTDDCRLH